MSYHLNKHTMISIAALLSSVSGKAIQDGESLQSYREASESSYSLFVKIEKSTGLRSSPIGNTPDSAIAMRVSPISISSNGNAAGSIKWLILAGERIAREITAEAERDRREREAAEQAAQARRAIEEVYARHQAAQARRAQEEARARQQAAQARRALEEVYAPQQAEEAAPAYQPALAAALAAQGAAYGQYEAPDEEPHEAPQQQFVEITQLDYEILKRIDGKSTTLAQMKDAGHYRPVTEEERLAVTTAFWKEMAMRIDGLKSLNPDDPEDDQIFLDLYKLTTYAGVPDTKLQAEEINDLEWGQLQNRLIQLATACGIDAAHTIPAEGDGPDGYYNIINGYPVDPSSSHNKIRLWLHKLMSEQNQKSLRRKLVKAVIGYIEKIHGKTRKDFIIEHILKNASKCVDRALSGLDSAEIAIKVASSNDATTLMAAIIQQYKKWVIERYIVNLAEGESVEQYLYLSLMLNARLGLGINSDTQMYYVHCGAKKTFDQALKEMLGALENTDGIIGYVAGNEQWQAKMETFPQYLQAADDAKQQQSELSEDIGSVDEFLNDYNDDGAAITPADREILKSLASTSIWAELTREQAGDHKSTLMELKAYADGNDAALARLPQNWIESWGFIYGQLYTKVKDLESNLKKDFTRQLFEQEYCVLKSKYAPIPEEAWEEVSEILNSDEARRIEQNLGLELAKAKAKLAIAKAKLAGLFSDIITDINGLTDYIATAEKIIRPFTEAQKNAAKYPYNATAQETLETVRKVVEEELQTFGESIESVANRIRENREYLEDLQSIMRQDDRPEVIQLLNEIAMLEAELEEEATPTVYHSGWHDAW